MLNLHAKINVRKQYSVYRLNNTNGQTPRKGVVFAILCAVLLGFALGFPPTTARAAEPLKLHRDAGKPAMAWSQKYPGIAVAVILGTQSKITPQQINSVLHKEFESAGVSDLAFFYEQNDMPSTIVVYYYSGASDGPFLLNSARPEAKKSAAQYLFQQNHPALAYEYPD